MTSELSDNVMRDDTDLVSIVITYPPNNIRLALPQFRELVIRICGEVNDAVLWCSLRRLSLLLRYLLRWA